MRARTVVTSIAAATAAALLLGGCSAEGGESNGDTVTVVYAKTASFEVLDTLMKTAK